PTPAPSNSSGSAGAPTQSGQGGGSPAAPTTKATTGRSPGSGGKRKTQPRCPSFGGASTPATEQPTISLPPNPRPTPPRHSPTVSNDGTDPEVPTTPAGLSAIEKFAFFQRFLAPPRPSPDTPGGMGSINSGQNAFVSVGCALCHTPTLMTGNSTVAALNNQPV